jgi:rubrerythrin
MRTFYRNGEEVSLEALRHSGDTAPVMLVMEALLAIPPSDTSCPHCGTTKEMIEATGLVGCPLCYAVHETFLLDRERARSQE